ncbi:glycosyl transferase [Rhizobium wenxiniae]|nr:glycosyl transferase [Rhizobium wenxiniae]
MTLISRPDRPFFRSATKLAIKLFFGRQWSHAQDWLPGLEIERVTDCSEGAVVYKNDRIVSLYRASVLKAAAGPIIHIVGSGPSLMRNDMGRMGRGTGILLNGAISLIGSPVAEPLGLAIEDERFVWRHFDLMRQKIRPGMICLFSVAVIRAICERDREWLRDKTIILIDNIRKPYRVARRTIPQVRELGIPIAKSEGEAAISLDPDAGVFQGGSVAISALQFALYCAPERIGMFGIDISNANQPRFYETKNDIAYSGIARAEARILSFFSLVKEVAAERNIELLNFSSVSALLKCGFPYDDRFASLNSEG